MEVNLGTTELRGWKQYEEYQSTNVAWLPRVPAHWRIKRLKFFAECLDGQRIPLNGEERGGMQGHIPYWGANGIVDYVDQCLFNEDLVLLGEDGAPFFEQDRPVAFFVTGKVWVNNHAHVLRLLSECKPKFLTHALNMVGYQQFIDGATRQKLTQRDMNSIAIQLPPLSEQRAIAAFLDRETARIDALIGHKQRLIALLEEKRQAVISHAVTKGLDPNVKMKDSRFFWLDGVPCQWPMTRLKFVAEVQTGLTLGKIYRDQELVERPYLRVANVQDGFLDLSEITKIQVPATDVERHELQAGDVLMTEGGDFDKLGRGFVWEGQINGCLHQNHVFAVRPNQSKLLPHYLSAVMTSAHGRTYFTFTSQQSTNLASTNSTKLGNFPIALPTIQEQHRILNYITDNAFTLTRCATRVKDGIAQLQEYRSALISAAVTGQIDVREEVQSDG